MASIQQKILYQGNSVISVETHPGYSHPVVVKKPSQRHPSPRSLRSLEREYEITRSLDGIQGVRKALGRLAIDNRPALILEYIDGEALGDAISKKTLSSRAKLEIAVELFRILGNIHQEGIIWKNTPNGRSGVKTAPHRPWGCMPIRFAVA